MVTKLLLPRIASICLGSLGLAMAVAPLPAAAEAFTMQPFQGGGEMFQNLPGVNLGDRDQQREDGCTQREVTQYDGMRFGPNGAGDYGPSTAVVNECKYGNFSIRTMRSGSGTGPKRFNFPDPRNPFGEYIPMN